MESIQITINDATHDVMKDSSLESIIEQFNLPAIGCVFAINNQVVPRSEWQGTCLSQGDAISLFQAIAGG